MAVTLKQVEALPANYPSAPSGLSTKAAALDADMIWQRIESSIAHRFTVRQVVWTVDGSGSWQPPLTPATASTVEVWEMGSWSETTPIPSPYGGYEFLGDGPYRITASVGGGDVPAAVNEALRRLAEYAAEIRENDMLSGHASYTTNSAKIGEAINQSFSRSTNWAARALQLSGAADLLRPYRRA